MRTGRHSREWQWLKVLCVLLVISYLLFEVLDLDGSNLSVAAALPVEALKSVDPAEVKWVAWPMLSSHASEVARLSIVLLAALGVHPPTTTPPPALYLALEIRGYRILLPRSDVSDALPAA